MGPDKQAGLMGSSCGRRVLSCGCGGCVCSGTVARCRPCSGTGPGVPGPRSPSSGVLPHQLQEKWLMLCEDSMK